MFLRLIKTIQLSIKWKTSITQSESILMVRLVLVFLETYSVFPGFRIISHHPRYETWTGFNPNNWISTNPYEQYWFVFHLYFKWYYMWVSCTTVSYDGSGSNGILLLAIVDWPWLTEYCPVVYTVGNGGSFVDLSYNLSRDLSESGFTNAGGADDCCVVWFCSCGAIALEIPDVLSLLVLGSCGCPGCSCSGTTVNWRRFFPLLKIHFHLNDHNNNNTLPK